MGEEEARKLIKDSRYLVDKKITVHFTNNEGQVKRTAACTVTDKTTSLGIGENGGPKNYSVNVLVEENGTDKKHYIPLRQIVKEYPKKAFD